MSFHLGGRRKPKLGGGPTNASSMRLLPRGAAGFAVSSRSVGRGQIQIHRPAVIQQEQTSQPQIQRTQGVISMEEVMADLRILEEQRVESVQLLQHARVTKQRRLEQLVILEETINHLLYQNGQKRAQLEHIFEQLSAGQRESNVIRNAVGRASDDVRAYDRKVKSALEVKVSLVADTRFHVRSIDELGGKTKKMDRRKRKKQLAHKRAEKQLETAKQFGESVREAVRNEAIKLRKIADSKAGRHVVCNDLERKIDEDRKEVTTLSANEKDWQKQICDGTTHEAELEAELQARKEKYLKRKQELLHSKVSVEKLSKAEAELLEVWNGAIELQVKEGHASSAPPSQTNQPPAIDIDRIHISLRAEIEANNEENRAAEQLSVSINSLEHSLSVSTAKHSSLLEKFQALKANNESGATIEAERKKEIDKKLAELQSADELLKLKRCSAQELLGERDEQKLKLLTELEVMCRTVRENAKMHEVLVQEIHALESAVASTQSCYEEMKQTDRMKILDMQEMVKETHQQSIALDEEILLVRQEQLDVESSKEQRDRSEQIQKARQFMAETFKLYPSLADVKFHFRSDLTDGEQGKIDLKRIVLDCKQREVKAEEKYAALKALAKERRAKQDQETVKHKAKPRKSCAVIEPDNPEESEKGESYGKLQTGKEKGADDEISAAKPRVLLGSFLRAIPSPDREVSDDHDEHSHKGESDAAALMTQPPSSYPIFAADGRDLTSSSDRGNARRSTFSRHTEPATQEKKVRFQETKDGSHGTEDLARVSMQNKSSIARRNSFGASSSEAAKERKKSDEKSDSSSKLPSQSEWSVPQKAKAAIIEKGAQSDEPNRTASSACQEHTQNTRRRSFGKIQSTKEREQSKSGVTGVAKKQTTRSSIIHDSQKIRNTSLGAHSSKSNSRPTDCQQGKDDNLVSQNDKARVKSREHNTQSTQTRHPEPGNTSADVQKRSHSSGVDNPAKRRSSDNGDSGRVKHLVTIAHAEQSPRSNSPRVSSAKSGGMPQARAKLSNEAPLGASGSIIETGSFRMRDTSHRSRSSNADAETMKSVTSKQKSLIDKTNRQFSSSQARKSEHDLRGKLNVVIKTKSIQQHHPDRSKASSLPSAPSRGTVRGISSNHQGSVSGSSRPHKTKGRISEGSVNSGMKSSSSAPHGKKRVTEQTSGIPSQERAPKRKRRAQSSAVSLTMFEDDSFEFGRQ